MDTSKQLGWPDSPWWELRTNLLRLDGQVGSVVNAEKHVVDSGPVSNDMARNLGRLLEQIGIDAGNGTSGLSDTAPAFERVKPGFTREAGSFRRRVPPHAVRDPGE